MCSVMSTSYKIIMEDVNYAWPVTAINRDDLLAFQNWLSSWHNKNERKMVYVWGAGIRGTEFGIFLKKNNIFDFLFVDNNIVKQKGHIDGVAIVSPSTAVANVKNKEAIILISTESDEGIIHQLQDEKLVYGQDFFTAKNLEYEHYVDEFMRRDKSKCVVMGDCLFSSISLLDNDYDNLADMMKKALGYENCKVLYMHGMGLRSYYNIFRMLCHNIGFPQSLEIMINFETLTGRQHVLPRSQHNMLFHLLDDKLNYKDEEWIEYLNIVDERSQNIQIEMSHSSKRLTPEQERDMKNRNYLRLNYMYKLDVQTEGLVYFRKLVDFSKQNNVEIIPFVPPVNYELGQKYFGEKFNDMYNSNLMVLKELIDGLDIELEDLSHVFTSNYFAEEDTTDESVNERGRRYLRDRLVGRIK